MRSERQFRAIVLCAVALKVWLTSFIAINVHFAPYDSGNFLEHAKFVLAGAWFGPYDDLTLIKGPGTELYLALIRELGISLPLGHQLLFALACLAVCRAIEPAVASAGARAAIFCALSFDPFTFSANAWTLNRSQISDSLALLCIAAAAGAILRAGGPLRALAAWVVALGFFAATLLLTREDTAWIVPPLLVFAALYLFAVRATHAPRRRLRAVLAVVPALCIATAYAVVATINGAVYGWTTTVETTAPDFVSAYQSFARIVVPGVADNRTYPAPRAVREAAAHVSPAAAIVESHFDPTHSWERTSCETLKLCDDVSAGWFVWALRKAVADAGYYRDGRTARAFYVRVATEIDGACATGRLVCRAKGYSLAPPMTLADAPAIVRYAAETLGHAVTFEGVQLGGAEGMSLADESVREDYAVVASTAGSHVASYRGWLVRDAGARLRLDQDFDGDFLDVDFDRSPDIARNFAGMPTYAHADLRRARFAIVTSCVRDCVLVVGTGARAARIPLDPRVTDFRKPGLVYHLDFSSLEPVPYATGGFKAFVLGLVLAFYQTAGPAAVAIALGLAAFRAVRIARGKYRGRAARVLGLASLPAVAVLGNCAMLGTVSAVSFYALVPEYQAALYPLVLLATAMELTVEGPVLLRIARRASRARATRRSVAPT